MNKYLKQIDEDILISNIAKSDNPEEIEFFLSVFFTIVDINNPKIERIIDIIDKKKLHNIFYNSISDSINLHSLYNVDNKYYYYTDDKRNIDEILDNTDIKYHEIIKRFLELSDKLKIDNSLDLSILFTYMLYCGCFSFNQKHKYEKNDNKIIYRYYAYEIFNGKGVCLNYSDMLTDILNERYKAAVLLCNTKDNQEKKLITGCNHAVVLIEEDNKLYIYDPTNHCIFKIINIRHAHNIAINKQLVLKPNYSITLTKNIKGINTIKELYLKNDYSSPYQIEEYDEKEKRIIELCQNNKELIREFYNDIFNNINTIKKETDNIKVKSI